MNENRKQFVSLALALTMTAGLLGSMSGCDKTEPGGRPSVVDTEKFPVMGSTEETQGVSEIFPGLDFSEKKGSPVLSDVIWLIGEPEFEGYRIYYDYFDRLGVQNDFYDFFCDVDYIRIKKADGSIHIIDYTGDTIGIYDEVSVPNDGLAIVKKGNKYGCIDEKGRLTGQWEYETAELYCSEGMVIVSKEGRKGCVDIKGDIVVPLEFSWVGDFSEGLAAVGNSGGFGFVNNKGQVVIPLEYDDMHNRERFSEGFAPVRKERKWGFIDASGQIAIPLEYDTVRDFNEGLARVEKDGKFGFVDVTGQMIVSPEYDYASDYINGVTIAEKNNQTFLIDATGYIICRLENTIGSFSDGLAPVMKDGKIGYISIKGNMVVPFEYDGITEIYGMEYPVLPSFYEGFAPVVKGKKWGVIDTNGHVVIPLEYDFPFFCYEGIASVCKDGKYGILNTAGEIILPLEYDSCLIINGGRVALVQKGGSWGFCTVTWP